MGIPFYPEPFISNDYCLAASIQMWAGYDRISPLPGQTQIFNWLGGSAGGFSPSVAAAGVVHFTRTSNAVYDAGLRTLQSDRDQFLARQVTAVQAESPALVIYSNHAVIVDGGLWHQDPVSYDYVWDYVDYHDPAAFSGDSELSAGDWRGMTCSPYVSGTYACVDVISSTFLSIGMDNYYTYGSHVRTKGSPYEI